MPMQMCKTMQFPRSCREGALLGCCSPGGGESSASATLKGTNWCCHPGKVQSCLSAGGAEQVQEVKCPAAVRLLEENDVSWQRYRSDILIHWKAFKI